MGHVLSSGLLVRKLLMVKGFTKKFYHGKNFDYRCKRKNTSFEGGYQSEYLDHWRWPLDISLDTYYIYRLVFFYQFW